MKNNILQFGQKLDRKGSAVAPEKTVTCQHEQLASGWEIKIQRCPESPVPGKLFCEKHDYCNDLLEAGSALGYPELEIGEHLIVGGSYGGYFAYAERMPERHALLVHHALTKASKKKRRAKITTISEAKLQSLINKYMRDEQQ